MSSSILKLGLVDAIKATLSASHKNKLIKEQAEKCLKCDPSSGRQVSVVHNGGHVREPTEITGFTYAENFSYYLPNQGYRNNRFNSPSKFYPYQYPINLTKAKIGWDDIEKSYRENKELTCAIKDTYLARAKQDAYNSCLSKVSQEMRPIIEKASVDALKVAGVKGATAGTIIGIGSAFLKGCDANASENPSILFPECEWDETFNVVERKRDIYVDKFGNFPPALGEDPIAIRFDEPIVSSTCAIGTTLLIQPGQYRLSKVTYKMKGWDRNTLRGLLAPVPEPPDPWRNHVPITNWVEIDPPLDSEGNRTQVAKNWSSEDLGISNLRYVSPGLSPIGSISPEQFSKAIGPALELLNVLSYGLYALRGGPQFLAIECALEQAFGNSSSTIY
jgi:hypothetical protein